MIQLPQQPELIGAEAGQGLRRFQVAGDRSFGSREKNSAQEHHNLYHSAAPMRPHQTHLLRAVRDLSTATDYPDQRHDPHYKRCGSEPRALQLEATGTFQRR